MNLRWYNNETEIKMGQETSFALSYNCCSSCTLRTSGLLKQLRYSLYKMIPYLCTPVISKNTVHKWKYKNSCEYVAQGNLETC